MTPVSDKLDTSTSPTAKTPAPVASVAAPVVKAGDHVWYVPHMDHHLDVDHRGNPVFEFEFARSYGSPRLSYKQGERVTDFGNLGRMRGMKKDFRRHPDGTYTTRGGHSIRVVGPGHAWPAVVREVFADGTVALDIAHPVSGSLPHGHKVFEGAVFCTLHYPDHGATTGLRYSKKFEPHTFHLLSDGKAV